MHKITKTSTGAFPKIVRRNNITIRLDTVLKSVIQRINSSNHYTAYPISYCLQHASLKCKQISL